jgi:hypothetical protein
MSLCKIVQMLGTNPGKFRDLDKGKEFLARFHSDHQIQVPANSEVIYVSRVQTREGSSYEWQQPETGPFDQRPAFLLERAAP